MPAIRTRVGAIVQDRLRQVPETLKTAQRSGRTELGEDTFGPNITELDVNLKDRSRLRDEVLDDVRRRLDGIVGFTFNVMQRTWTRRGVHTTTQRRAACS